MRNIKEESLAKALLELDLTELPKEDDGNDFWIRAIAEVEKTDLSHSYIYVEKDPDSLDNVIKADFGKMVQINKIISYHPFCYLGSNYLPEFKTKNKEEREKYLNAVNPGDYSKMTLKELNREVLKIAVKKHLDVEKASYYAKRDSQD